MELAELQAQYAVNAQGFITTPGKFEGERLYVPYFWTADGGPDVTTTDTTGTTVHAWKINSEDRALFPDELNNRDLVMLIETDDGFVTEV